jgi:hypothetical protein
MSGYVRNRVELDDGQLCLGTPDARIRRLRLELYETVEGLYFTALGDCLDLQVIGVLLVTTGTAAGTVE